MKEKILIVEDEFIVANDLKIMLQKAGYTVAGIAASAEQARRLIEEKRPDWILLDIILKGNQTGIDLAQELKQKGLPFLYISANTNQRILEAAKATSPYGFLVKPFREKDLLVMLDIARYKFDSEHATVVQKAQTVAPVTGIIGKSKLLQTVLHRIARVAPTTTSVLILGESGTGKEKIAETVHAQSARKDKPLITVNCAALPLNLVESELFGYEKGAFTGANQKRLGKFEQANGGSIFLDEIGELPLEAQVKLLRVLQQKEIERLGGEGTIAVDVRIIAATNRNLEKEVAEGRFRLDLYYRLNVFPVELPPLRERKEDIRPLALHFLQKYAAATGLAVTGIAEPVLQQMEAYNWPGNIRELEHAIERQVLLSDPPEIVSIQLAATYTSLPAEEENAPLKSLQEMEKEHIIRALKQCRGRVSGGGGAAELLGIPAQTLYTKMKKLGIESSYA